MKSMLFCVVFLLLSSLCVKVVASSPYIQFSFLDESYRENFQLETISALWERSSSVEDFERLINDSALYITDIDINADGRIDSLRPILYNEGTVKEVLIQAKLARNIYVDIFRLHIIPISDDEIQEVGADEEGIEYGDIPSNFCLENILIEFFISNSIERFEYNLNFPKNRISNVDCNEDGYIDCMFVNEDVQQNTHIIFVNAVLGDNKYQQLACIYVAVDQSNKLVVEIVGDKHIYGKNYIVKPIWLTPPTMLDYLFEPQRPCYYSRNYICGPPVSCIETQLYQSKTKKFLADHKSTIYDFIYPTQQSEVFMYVYPPAGYQYYVDMRERKSAKQTDTAILDEEHDNTPISVMSKTAKGETHRRKSSASYAMPLPYTSDTTTIHRNVASTSVSDTLTMASSSTSQHIGDSTRRGETPSIHQPLTSTSHTFVPMRSMPDTSEEPFVKPYPSSKSTSTQRSSTSSSTPNTTSSQRSSSSYPSVNSASPQRSTSPSPATRSNPTPRPAATSSTTHTTPAARPTNTSASSHTTPMQRSSGQASSSKHVAPAQRPTTAPAKSTSAPSHPAPPPVKKDDKQKQNGKK